jgi:hypothetical protein
VSDQAAPILDGRDVDAIVAAVLDRLPAYVPGWNPPKGGPGRTLLEVFGRSLRALLERLNQAPRKNKLAFLDMLGISLLPAQAARAPVAFQPRPKMPNGRIMAGTRVGATMSGQADLVVFETEDSIALAAANLEEVVSLWPGSDAYTDHSADVAAGRPFTLFDPQAPVRHELYLAHDTHFALSGPSTVELRFELAAPGTNPLPMAWEYWDGKVWRGFKDFRLQDSENESFDGTKGLTRSGVIRLHADCAETAKTTVGGIESYWIRGRVTASMPPQQGVAVPLVDRIKVRTFIQPTGLRPDAAFADGTKLDLSKTFLPLGNRPQPGSAFYLSSQELLSKPGAAATIKLETRDLPQYPVSSGATSFTPKPEVDWEYWEGGEWRALDPQVSPSVADADTFRASGNVMFVIPSSMDPVTVNGQEALWLRVRLRSGGYGGTIPVQLQGGSTINIVEIVPPALASISLDYTYTSPQDPPDACVTYHDFRWEDHTEDAAWRGGTFEPFSPILERTPALYLGFDQPLPADLISLYFDVVEVVGGTLGPPLRWEYWNGSAWAELVVVDETQNLALPGMVQVLWPGIPEPPQAPVIKTDGRTLEVSEPRQLARFVPGDQVFLSKGNAGELGVVDSVARDTMRLVAPPSADYSQGTVALAALPRFGTPRTWLRARLLLDGEPRRSQMSGIFLNAVWADQVQTFVNELLGSSNAQPDQAFFFRNKPVLAGQVVEVRELDGPRAAAENAMLLDDLARKGMSAADTRHVTDPRTGQVTAAWVRWMERPNLYFSGPDDRHYVIERSSGRLLFGDGRHGRIPPAGRDNIRTPKYRSGGGQVGSVSAGAISQLLSGVLAQSASNPRAAEGGADGQPVTEVQLTGPLTIRDRRQAISLGDYEALAHEASAAVAVARALPVTDPTGRPAQGWVNVLIVPHSQDPKPQASFALRQEVQQYIAARMPAAAGTHISVTGPDYLEVGVRAVVVPVDLSDGGPVRDSVVAALEGFLHPVTGGPDGTGWPFGRDVYLSDVAVLVESRRGVDHVETIDLLLGGTPLGEVVQVPPDRIVVAGRLRITLAGTED